MGAGMSAANASVVWDVSATFSDGATLTGTFTINQYGYLQSADLVTTGMGAFSGYTYTLADSYISTGTNYIDFEPGYTSDLHLQFAGNLTDPVADNSIILASSYECFGSYSCYDAGGGTIRYLVGTPSAEEVPEPAIWTMLLLGFLSLGAMLRLSRPARYTDSLAV